jgi:rhamnopyranosyl-N-acetylglucosaminyl-diphospho-decaprenol beta-1,3/1,4-galactofuranosyltransferase
MKDVAVVLVTYNREKYLGVCLRALLKQDLPPTKIIIIDNASTDNTALICEEFRQIDQKIEYHQLSENTGGAGGFSYGMRLAFESGSTWLWLMDDDVEPLPDALQSCVPFMETFKCIQMSRLTPDGGRFLWNQVYSPELNLSFTRKFPENEDFCFTNTACFEGLLLHRDVVEKVGYPIAELFIRWDDLIYGFFVSQQFNIILVKNALIRRQLKFENYLNEFSIFYELRNRIITRKIMHSRVQFQMPIKIIAIIIEFLIIAGQLCKNPKFYRTIGRAIVRARVLSRTIL